MTTVSHLTRSAVVGIVLGGLAIPLAASEPVDQQNYAKVTFCNKSRDTVSVIVIHRHYYNSTLQMLNGWRQVAASECRSIGSFPRGSVWFYAKNSKGVEWKASDAFACVAPRPTERAIYENEKCVEGEARLGFFLRTMNAAEETVSISE